MANPRVFLDLNISGQPAGRLVIELFADSTPITTKNFWALCAGEKGIGKNREPLHYKGTTYYRMIPRSLFNGGDITEGNGLGGESIYNDSFTDENLVNKHTGPRILSMANTGPGINGSQFLICTTKAEWLDGTHVIFGQVVEGFDVIKAVQKVGSLSVVYGLKPENTYDELGESVCKSLGSTPCGLYFVIVVYGLKLGYTYDEPGESLCKSVGITHCVVSFLHPGILMISLGNLHAKARGITLCGLYFVIVVYGLKPGYTYDEPRESLCKSAGIILCGLYWVIVISFLRPMYTYDEPAESPCKSL
ncbi:hypothetical protein Dsin_001962 [Dipteronia sinensis]|uniref:peptidylprolyl isomerase n=1 Tax=Dipteronia sinensis TaxID=43782 RepID=A0AAE0B4V9_9ROSI|nr:hypothetical protein Dsin_001962 [Dipteronia sinensis]